MHKKRTKNTKQAKTLDKNQTNFLVSLDFLWHLCYTMLRVGGSLSIWTGTRMTSAHREPSGKSRLSVHSNGVARETSGHSSGRSHGARRKNASQTWTAKLCPFLRRLAGMSLRRLFLLELWQGMNAENDDETNACRHRPLRE